MRILFTNLSLSSLGGVEMYLFDLAKELLRREYRPCVYAPTLGPIADKFREATIPVTDDLVCLHEAPDIIHGNYGLATMAAAMRFPQTPLVSMCHAWRWENDVPPPATRVHRYLAVDETCRDRLICQAGVSPERVIVLHNAVDLSRFERRPALPAAPRRALAIGNYIRKRHFAILKRACDARGIELDGFGRTLGSQCEAPERILKQYDLIFAKGRCAWEALATGCAVILYDVGKLGPYVSSKHLAPYRRKNFGQRLLLDPLTAKGVAERLDEFDAQDAARVTEIIRASHSLTELGDQITDFYREIIAEHPPAAEAVSDSLALVDCLQRMCREYYATVQLRHYPQRGLPALVRKWRQSITKRLVAKLEYRPQAA